MTSPGLEALSIALQAEYGAVFAFGVVEAFAGPNAAMASADLAAHRAWRDSIIATLSFEGVEVPAAAAGYELPGPVDDEQSAADAAVAAEIDTTTAWRSVAEKAESVRTRQEAVIALTEAAIRLAKWRIAAGVNPPSTPFPGQP